MTDSEVGFEQVDVPADGNCFFHALVTSCWDVPDLLEKVCAAMPIVGGKTVLSHLKSEGLFSGDSLYENAVHAMRMSVAYMVGANTDDIVSGTYKTINEVDPDTKTRIFEENKELLEHMKGGSFTAFQERELDRIIEEGEYVLEMHVAMVRFALKDSGSGVELRVVSAAPMPESCEFGTDTSITLVKTNDHYMAMRRIPTWKRVPERP